jgi:glycine dehydrogenase subunit 2
VVLIPDGAHGTNPASAAMAGFRHVTIKSADGTVRRHGPSRASSTTNGRVHDHQSQHAGPVRDKQVARDRRSVHDAGGLVYLDGANMNAILGIARPGDFGADMMHYNPHKTFSGPHGGGGPGAGPIAVAPRSWPPTCLRRRS